MSTPVESIHHKLLAELEGFERRQEALSGEDLRDWKERALSSLSPGYRARMGRLNLYEETEDFSTDDDLPF